ncbi:BTB domain-containing protein [Mycena sanguinolenta]|uniref:BTB domain-containing protein n=1 Tax=Mycena sanguinolenta TaxID=230812 RepID=A0A8H7DDJ1_9AGAR|nr:BTB domain-containing protein [Mycena sanguinolenta]
MSSPPAKRPRTEDAPMKRSDKFWFTDGTVVLRAGNTQFRVHFGVLARHSAIFSDMLGLPQPSDEPNVDGCPVVQLSDDPTDVEYLLNALYDPMFLLRKRLPLAAIGAFIRLGRKYDFKNFLNLAVSRLRDEFPTTLTKYDALSICDTIQWYDGIDLDIVTLLSESNIFFRTPTRVLPCCAHDSASKSDFPSTENMDG